MGWMVGITGGLAAIAWASAFMHMLLLLSHRRDDVSLASLLSNGYRFWSRDTWKPSGHAIHARFLGSGLAFFVLVLVTFVVGAVSVAR